MSILKDSDRQTLMQALSQLFSGDLGLLADALTDDASRVALLQQVVGSLQLAVSSSLAAVDAAAADTKTALASTLQSCSAILAALPVVTPPPPSP